MVVGVIIDNFQKCQEEVNDDMDNDDNDDDKSVEAESEKQDPEGKYFVSMPLLLVICLESASFK